MDLIIRAKGDTYRLSELDRMTVDVDAGVIEIIKDGFCTRYKIEEISIKPVE